MASVTLDHVTKVYKEKRESITAVDDFSLTIADREFVVLVGPSGCGKTTTLRIIAGLESISEGTVSIGDKTVNDIEPKDRDVAMVFQNYALYPHMTVFKNMAFGLKMRRVSKNEISKKVTDVAELLGLEGLLERKPDALSGGEKQRVALGRAIVRDPSVFLFDEPLSNLDAQLRLAMRSEIKSLHHKLQRTTLYVTHDQEEAMTLGDRIVVMADGCIRQCGTPWEVYNEPANRFVAEFIGSPPMSFLDGRFEMNGDEAIFVCDECSVPLLSEQAATAKNHAGRPVSLGIRREHVRIVDPKEPSREGSPSNHVANIGEMTIELIEPLGDVTNVHLRSANGFRVIAKAPANYREDATAKAVVKLDEMGIHFFDQSNGLRLT